MGSFLPLVSHPRWCTLQRRSGNVSRHITQASMCGVLIANVLASRSHVRMTSQLRLVIFLTYQKGFTIMLLTLFSITAMIIIIGLVLTLVRRPLVVVNANSLYKSPCEIEYADSKCEESYILEEREEAARMAFLEGYRTPEQIAHEEEEIDADYERTYREEFGSEDLGCGDDGDDLGKITVKLHTPEHCDLCAQDEEYVHWMNYQNAFPQVRLPQYAASLKF